MSQKPRLLVVDDESKNFWLFDADCGVLFFDFARNFR